MWFGGNPENSWRRRFHGILFSSLSLPITKYLQSFVLLLSTSPRTTICEQCFLFFFLQAGKYPWIVALNFGSTDGLSPVLILKYFMYLIGAAWAWFWFPNIFSKYSNYFVRVAVGPLSLPLLGLSLLLIVSGKCIAVKNWMVILIWQCDDICLINNIKDQILLLS